MNASHPGFGGASAGDPGPRLWELLVCPRDKEALQRDGTSAVCPQGHRYAVIDDVPILLVSEVEQTHIEGTRALAVAESGDASTLPTFDVQPGEIDPFVRNVISATNGSLYQHLVGNLKEYPIPHLRLPPGDGKLLLEVGCNWGRWCVAAARAGYRPIGIDPSLKAIRAAKRVARQLGIKAEYAVADGRYLPFRENTFDQIFSYSVLQHISRENVATSLAEMRRVLTVDGGVLVQMPNMFGVRCLYHQARRGFREERDFEVRYWKPSELLKAFSTSIGPSELSVDGFFSLNVQPSDLHLLPAKYRAVVRTSEVLRRLSNKVPALGKVADSLYVSARRSV
ncbi:MAG: methyltransferase domain-containing protein [Candidatus Sulfotelmatobacter sp.]